MESNEATVLVVDDDRALNLVLCGLLRQEGFEAVPASNAEAALKLVSERPIDVVMTDHRMPGRDGMELLAELVQRYPDMPVILLTAHGSVPMAVEAMRRGAFDFLCKPFDREEVLHSLRRAAALAREREVRPAVPQGSQLLGPSKAMQKLNELLGKAAGVNATVLIRGESGTGKELAARSLHELGPTRKGPFVAVNCSALPDTLLESELFGYERGAFTGAVTRKPGRVALASGGTLFLDEIGDISAALQAKLLRLLQEREYQPLGAAKSIATDARFVAATHRDLEAMVKAGTFREDLYYRLNVVPVSLPPLRERPDDIIVLAQHFCRRFAEQHKRKARFSEAALALLAQQPWPGNVRQLGNVVERLVIFNDDGVIGHEAVAGALGPAASSLPTVPPSGDGSRPSQLSDQRDAAERTAIRQALQKAEGNRSLAARLLGVSRRTLYNKLEQLQIESG